MHWGRRGTRIFPPLFGGIGQLNDLTLIRPLKTHGSFYEPDPDPDLGCDL